MNGVPHCQHFFCAIVPAAPQYSHRMPVPHYPHPLDFSISGINVVGKVILSKRKPSVMLAKRLLQEALICRTEKVVTAGTL
jgi:hypothetical protein